MPLEGTDCLLISLGRPTWTSSSAASSLSPYLFFALTCLLTTSDLLFCSPGVSSAKKGHHYAGPTNVSRSVDRPSIPPSTPNARCFFSLSTSKRFWPCIHQSGIIPDAVTYKDDARLPQDYNIGLVRPSAHFALLHPPSGPDSLLLPFHP